MTPAQGIRVGTGVVTALLAGMASWLLLVLVRSVGGSYPVISWIGLVPLLAVLFAGVTPSKALASFAHPIIFLFLGGFALAAALVLSGILLVNLR